MTRSVQWLLRSPPMTQARIDAPARIDVYVQPRASITAVVGHHDGRIKIKLKAPPVDGAANAALVAFVAERLGIPKQRVRLVAGQSSRRKVLEIDGLSVAAVQAALS